MGLQAEREQSLGRGCRPVSMRKEGVGRDPKILDRIMCGGWSGEGISK